MDPRRKIFDETSRELHAFFKRVGKIWIYEELKFLELEPQMMTGEFWSGSVQLLIDFCDSNPGYHIITSTDGKVFNKFIAKAHFYYLADGDTDPDLVVDLGAGLKVQELLEIRHTMFTPIFGKIDGGDDT